MPIDTSSTFRGNPELSRDKNEANPRKSGKSRNKTESETGTENPFSDWTH